MDVDQLKRDVLADCVFEDYQMIWEPLGWLRTQLPETPDPERQSMAESALRGLYNDRLIYLFRVMSGPVGGFANDPANRLSPEEVDSIILGTDWRTVPLGPDGPTVWIAPTERGEEIARRSN